ncbi:unnamed protein product [Parnassius apollo]|uniref:(apollo) hypothetical protein n=1 Tax=Parnassius apollo TaxID=110799 RepID=A0A8S3WB54_PARAO|nr:unnamed protein product [Parnassius apollo]
MMELNRTRKGPLPGGRQGATTQQPLASIIPTSWLGVGRVFAGPAIGTRLWWSTPHALDNPDEQQRIAGVF